MLVYSHVKNNLWRPEKLVFVNRFPMESCVLGQIQVVNTKQYWKLNFLKEICIKLGWNPYIPSCMECVVQLNFFREVQVYTMYKSLLVQITYCATIMDNCTA